MSWKLIKSAFLQVCVFLKASIYVFTRRYQVLRKYSECQGYVHHTRSEGTRQRVYDIYTWYIIPQVPVVHDYTALLHACVYAR